MELGQKRGAKDVDAPTKRFKHSESESLASGIESKTKPCMKFFSTTGCSYGDSCHFLHYVAGGFNAAAQMKNISSAPTFHTPRNNMGRAPSFSDGPPSAVKTKLCKRYSSAEGCKFGEKCYFAHGETELGRPTMQSYEARGPMSQPQRNDFAAANYGASATTRIAINAALAGPIIGKGGCNSKHISRMTGVKLKIREIESDSSQRNIELEGTFDQIQQAIAMVEEIIMGLGPVKPPPAKPTLSIPTKNSKTKVCAHFLKGTCNFGDKCNFAHGENELRNSQPA